jgi:tetratricopeptide (TPR) repeat protein
MATMTPEDDAAAQKAIELRSEDKREDAVGILLPLTQKYSENYGMRWYTAGVLSELGRYSEAVGLLKEALCIKPSFTRAAGLLVSMYENLHDYESALQEMKRFMKIKNSKDFRETVMFFLEAQHDNPACASVLEQLRAELAQHDFYREALQAVDDFFADDAEPMTKMVPADRALFMNVLELPHEDKGEDALAILLPLVQKYTDSYTLRWAAAITLWNLGRFREAVDMLNDALRINPSYTRASDLRVLLYRELGAYESAAAEVKRFIRIKDSIVYRASVKLFLDCEEDNPACANVLDDLREEIAKHDFYREALGK